MRRFLPLAAPLALLSACGEDSPQLSVSNATVSATPASAAVYATIANDGGPDRLTGIEIDGRVPIGLHLTSNEGGVSRMRPVESLDIPDGGTLTLASGGAHGMAMGRIEATGTVPLTFRFARSAPIRVRASLTGPSGAARQ